MQRENLIEKCNRENVEKRKFEMLENTKNGRSYKHMKEDALDREK